MKKRKREIYILCFIATVIFIFIPRIGSRMEDGYTFFGFPAQWLRLSEGRIVRVFI